MTTYYITKNCINIDSRLDYYSWLRNETLNRCHAMNGYSELPLAEKNKVYDQVKKQIEKENRQ